MNNLNGLSRKLILIVFVIALIGGGGNWVYLRMTHVYTDDARIAADMIDMSSKVAGWIVDFPVSSGDRVKRGDVLAEIDSREAKLKLKQLQARDSALRAGYEAQQQEILMVEEQTGGANQGAESRLNAAVAVLSASTSDLNLRSSEWQRSQSLRKKKIISLQRFEVSQALFEKARQTREAAVANVAQARAGLIEVEAMRSQLKVMERNLAKLQYERDGLQAELERQRIDISERKILAPVEGIIDNLFADSGEYIIPGMRMLLMHNPEDIWVSANVKETQIRYLNVGQSVEISVDAYPDMDFSGEIIKIGNVATSQFSLLPSTNPSGNFTKVTQRLTVKIAVQQRELLLKPGMMVEVAIDVR